MVSKKGSTMEQKTVTRKESNMNRSVTSVRPTVTKRPSKIKTQPAKTTGVTLASPRSPSKGQGIGGLIASMRDVEQRIEMMES